MGMPKFPTYKELLKLTKEKLDEAMAAPRANEMKQAAKLEMAKLDSALVRLEQQAQSLVTKYPIDFTAVLQAQDEAALTERRRDQFAKLISELFPDE